MQIHFGDFESALKAGPTEWTQFPYKRQDDQYSFSQVLFRSIGIPEAISDGASNITMHQIMRLIYGDQMTPIQRIFRTENFDTWQTRQAVGELMCGIGGYDLYDRQIQLRALDAQFTEVALELRNLMKVASGYGDKILAEFITPTLNNMNNDRKGLLEQLQAVMNATQEATEVDTEAERNRKSLTRELGKARRNVAELEDRIAGLEYEIEDSQQFMLHLEETLGEFNDATTTFFALGQVRFEFCPACFAPTKEPTKLACHLCGTETKSKEPDSAAIAVKLDFEMQLKESRAIQADRIDSLARLKTRLRAANTNLGRLVDASEIARRGYGTERENLVADLSRKIGYLDSEIQLLQKRLELASEIAQLSKKKEDLNSQITKLKTTIEAIEAGQARRKQIAYSAVSDNAKLVANQDLAAHNDFGVMDHISFSFAEDWMAINDDKNRAGSASGMVVLKNSFLFGLFLSSLTDTMFALPRFMLMDNIEDKGMVEERSWNFQRVIVKECAANKAEHQIIFTTSKIAPEFADTSYVSVVNTRGRSHH
jgi:predicted  nucleic acid-binding Zn-ribbon protein